MSFLEHLKIDFRFVFALVALIAIVSSASAQSAQQQGNIATAQVYLIANQTNDTSGNVAIEQYAYLGDLDMKKEFAQGEPVYLSATLANPMGYPQDMIVTLRISGNQIMYEKDIATPSAASYASENSIRASESGTESQEGSIAIADSSRTYYVSQKYSLGAYEKRTVEFKVSQDDLPYSETIGVMCAAQASTSASYSIAQNDNATYCINGSGDDFCTSESAIYPEGSTTQAPAGCNMKYKGYTARLMAAPAADSENGQIYAPGRRGAAISGTFRIVLDSDSTVPIPIPDPLPTVVKQEIQPGWNLVSAPTQPYESIDYNDCKISSPFWSYNPLTGQYEKKDKTSYADGYWIYSANKCTLKYVVPFGLVGMPNPSSPKHLYAGWNMVGNPFMFLSPNPSMNQLTGCTITSGPWGYDSSSQQYVKADSLSNGNGYWIKVDSECDLYYKDVNTPPAPPQ